MQDNEIDRKAGDSHTNANGNIGGDIVSVIAVELYYIIVLRDYYEQMFIVDSYLSSR